MENDTAQQRIRDAAIRHYAAEGFSKPGLQAIAEAALVGPDVMASCFAGEAELRGACDEFVLQTLVGWARIKATVSGLQEIMGTYMADPDAYQVLIDYLGRSVAENTEGAAKFVDVLVDETESILKAGADDGTMRPSSDPRAMAVLVTVSVLAFAMMMPHIERSLDSHGTRLQVMMRLALPALELYTHGLYADEAFLNTVRDALKPDSEAGGTPGGPGVSQAP